MTISLIVDTTLIMQNQQLSGTLPYDYMDPLSLIYFGKAFSADSSFDGNIRTLIGGEGAFYTLDTTSTDCTFSVGITNPYCLVCYATTTSNLYASVDGSCLSECPDGTYLDSTSLFCI